MKYLTHLFFIAGIIAMLALGEPLMELTWRQIVSLSAFPWLLSYAAYHIGELIGHKNGWQKARHDWYGRQACRPPRPPRHSRPPLHPCQSQLRIQDAGWPPWGEPPPTPSSLLGQPCQPRQTQRSHS